MLLLVLILVLIAFGLLVVALLSGSVLWAWVSVGVSVAAAAVLLVDWLQRRSALRAGAEAGDAAPTAVPLATLPRSRSWSRPRRSSPRSPRAVSERRMAAAPGVAADRRRDERHEAQETVVLRAVAPPGSAEGPSGARGGIGPSEPIWSQNVTKSDAAGSPSGARTASARRPRTPTRTPRTRSRWPARPGPTPARRTRDAPARRRRRAASPSRPGAAGRARAGPPPARTGRRPARGAARRRRRRARGRRGGRGARRGRAAALPPRRLPLARGHPGDPAAGPRGRRAGLHPLRLGRTPDRRSRAGNGISGLPPSEGHPPRW